MEPAAKPVSKSRIVLTWVAMVGMVLLLVVICFWGGHALTAPAAEPPEAPSAGVVHAIFFLLAGVFFLVLGVAGYLAIIFSGCFTFNYRRPVWDAVKTKQYIANIFVIVALGLGVGFVLSAVLFPILTALGLDAGMASVLPVIAAIVGIQLIQLWVLIWAPVERQVITKRLATMGVTPAQLQEATLVGLSNPASGMAKRFAAIEEDMGALWVTPERLMYRGDSEQLDVSRDQIAAIERKTDNRSTTVLAGIAHVVLHLKLPGSGIRQIRLHVEGLWTMGRKKKVMDSLADAITSWHTAGS